VIPDPRARPTRDSDTAREQRIPEPGHRPRSLQQCLCHVSRKATRYSLQEHAEASQGGTHEVLACHAPPRATPPRSARAALRSLTPRSHSAAPALARRPPPRSQPTEPSHNHSKVTCTASTHRRLHGALADHRTYSPLYRVQPTADIRHPVRRDTPPQPRQPGPRLPGVGPDRSANATHARTWLWEIRAPALPVTVLPQIVAMWIVTRVEADPAALTVPLMPLGCACEHALALAVSWRVLHGGRRGNCWKMDRRLAVHRYPPRTVAREFSLT